MNKENTHYIALGSRLKGIPEVLTLGVRPNFLDYSLHERELIYNADIMLYPTLNYSQFLTTIGKRIFPSLETYIYADDKIKQTTLFIMQEIPHPFTRIYYQRHHEDIIKDFRFPFVGKLPRRSSQGRGIYKINNQTELQEYLKLTKIAYIQEYIPHERDLRVILINYKPILAYWRVCPEKTFKSNVFQGGIINFDDIPEDGLLLAQEYSKKCRFNDVGLDMIKVHGKWHLIEGNMKYGRTGLKLKGMDLKKILREKLISGELASDRDY